MARPRPHHLGDIRGRKDSDAVRQHRDWRRSDLPSGVPRPGWQFQDPRGTREFYEGRVQAYASEHGMTYKQARESGEFRSAWSIYKQMIGREANQNQAARDFVLAERLRAGTITRAEYVHALTEGRDLTTRDDQRQWLQRSQQPLTRETYEAVMTHNTVFYGKDGSLAHAMVVLGLRSPADTWDVGDTP